MPLVRTAECAQAMAFTEKKNSIHNVGGMSWRVTGDGECPDLSVACSERLSVAKRGRNLYPGRAHAAPFDKTSLTFQSHHFGSGEGHDGTHVVAMTMREQNGPYCVGRQIAT